MAKDTTTDFENPVTENKQEGHERLNNENAISSTKITKDCVEQLIDKINETLKTSK